MSSSINTVCRSHKPTIGRIVITAVFFLSAFAFAQNVSLRPPTAAVAGNAASIAADGSGSATLYLVGPSGSVKRDVQLGGEITLSPRDLQAAGRYVAIVCSGDCSSASFFVAPSKPVTLTFLVHPSRAPVAENDAISGVALAFDEFHNLVMKPASVRFELNAKGASSTSRTSETHDGIAWFRTNSGKSAGPLQITASITDDISTRRVVQEVASVPCNLRIKGERTPKGIVVETDPVRDCSGNPVPDGTVVTFTAKSGGETGSVDAPVKQDVARATILANGPVSISAASGVAMGNELRLGGKE